MVKYLLETEYVGTNYSGWQIQDSAPSIQESLESAIQKFCGEKTVAYSSGRTDAGVHAIKMPVHIELSKEYDPYKILMGTNFHLKDAGDTISVLTVKKVDDDFHARFNVSAKEYIYKINMGEYDPIFKDYIYQYNTFLFQCIFLIPEHSFPQVS